MKRPVTTAAALLLAAAVAGCQHTVQPAPGRATRPAPPIGVAVPEVLTVVCGATGTTVTPDRITAAADGVHIRVRDESGYGDVYLNVRYGTAMGEGSGDPMAHGTSNRILSIPPGPARLYCSHDASTGIDPPVPVEVVDPAGHWQSGALAGLGCTSPEKTVVDWVYNPGRGATADRALADLARQFTLPATAERVQNGYAAAATQTYVFRRAGRPWATALVTRGAPGSYSAELGAPCGRRPARGG